MKKLCPKPELMTRTGSDVTPRETRRIHEEVSTAAASKGLALTNLRSIRNRAMGAVDERRSDAAMTVVHNLENALGALQSDVNAAMADVANAKTPTQRSVAEDRLAKLMEQKRRLELQLAQAKLRQLNAVGKKMAPGLG